MRGAAAYVPPDQISRTEIECQSRDVLDLPDIPFSEAETLLELNAAGLEWDVGCMSYRPHDETAIPSGSDGRKVGVFMTHGGASDWRSLETLARLLTGKLGFHVVVMTYPGRLYLPDPSRDWPGDTIRSDGSVRTPIWKQGEAVARDEYEVVHDRSMRARHGIRTCARARPGTRFHARMASWPLAFETAMKQACRTFFPDTTYSIYLHGHSTGGPFVNMLSQRVKNIAGVIGIENSPFGYIYQRMAGIVWKGPFNDLLIRNWREIARYRGAEALKQDGPRALLSLAALMEDVLDEWGNSTRYPQFKAEYIIHYASAPALEAAARATAERLRLGVAATDELVEHYIGMGQELSGTDVRPVPPLLLGITAYSRDHTYEKYRDIVVPAYEAMTPAPKIRIVRFGAGLHSYWAPEKGLPMGILPAVILLWRDAITGGYFVVKER